MEIRNPAPTAEVGKPTATSERPPAWKGLIEAARFWEPRRLLYNFLLTGVVLIWVVKTWPHFRPAMTNHDRAGAARQRLLLRGVSCGDSDPERDFERSVEPAAVGDLGSRDAIRDTLRKLLDCG